MTKDKESFLTNTQPSLSIKINYLLMTLFSHFLYFNLDFFSNILYILNMNIISREIDYSIRILSLLSNIEKATVDEISKILYIPKPFAHKIVNKLVRKNYLISSQGRGGYIEFNKELKTDKISVLDIMKDLDGYKHVNLCTDNPEACELNPYCSFTYHLQKLELCINKALNDLKLKDIIFKI